LKRLQDIVLELPVQGRFVGVVSEKPVVAFGHVTNVGHDDSSRIGYLLHGGEAQVKLKVRIIGLYFIKTVFCIAIKGFRGTIFTTLILLSKDEAYFSCWFVVKLCLTEFALSISMISNYSQ
jgi:hypothetical protein